MGGGGGGRVLHGEQVQQLECLQLAAEPGREAVVARVLPGAQHSLHRFGLQSQQVLLVRYKIKG